MSKENPEEAAAAQGSEQADEGQLPETVVVVIDLPSGKRLMLPMPVFIGETFAVVRQSLAEYQESVHYTNFHLTLKELRAASGETVEISNDSEAFQCHDFLEISSCFAAAADPDAAALICSNMGTVLLQMRNDQYDVKKVIAQLKRTNEILRNPPLLKAHNDAVAASTEERGGQEEEKGPETDSPLPVVTSILQPITLGNFYNELLFKPAAVEQDSLLKEEEVRTVLTTAVRSVFASGWNPVNPARRLRGDLLYIEVALSNERTIHITATPNGFYVNKSNRHCFDPLPAAQSFSSTTLFSCLLSASSALRSAWEQVQIHGKPAGGLRTVSTEGATESQQQSEEEEPLKLLARAYIQTKGDGMSQTTQWNAFSMPDLSPASESGKEIYDLNAAQEQLSNLYSVEELGAAREWNEEIQSIRALAANDLNEKVMKARLEFKIISEFTQACKTIVTAICDGMIAPLAFADPQQTEIYVYNGIFFSKAEDAKDSFKICNGDDAFAKCTGHELHNQKLIRTLGLDTISTVMCCVVDFKGQRFVCQSIIPGIFSQGDNIASLQYGILERNNIVTVKNSSLPLMKSVCEKLFLAERSMRLVPFKSEPSITEAAAPESTDDVIDDKQPRRIKDVLEGKEQSSPIHVDEVGNIAVAGVNESVPHYGPIEGKILKGSDGRLYILEVMRLTPRDANYVKGEKGTGLIPAELLSATDTDLNVAYVLRHELINLFVQSRINRARQKIIIETTERERKNAKSESDSANSSAAATAAAIEGDSNAATAVTKAAEKEDKVISVNVNEDEEDGDRDTTNDAPPAAPTLDEAAQLRLTSEYAEKFREITPSKLGLEFCPNCFLDFEFDVDESVREKDETLAREVAAFLWETMLPAVTRQIRDGDLVPKDSAAMVDTLHQMGINMRYLGALATLAEREEEEDANFLLNGKQRVNAMPLYWREMLVVEIIARAFKHVLNGMMKAHADVFNAPAKTIASLLNHVMSLLWSNGDFTSENSEGMEAAEAVAVKGGNNYSKKNKKKKSGRSVAVPSSSENCDGGVFAVPFSDPDAAACREDVLNSIEKTIRARFCIDLPLIINGDAIAGGTVATNDDNKSATPVAPQLSRSEAVASFFQTRLSPITLLRRICQLSGIVLVTKNYEFQPRTAEENKPKSTASGEQQNPEKQVHQVFAAKDILGLFPITKSCEADMPLPEFGAMLQNSNAYLQQGNHSAAYEIAQQAASVISQITGQYHKSSLQAVEQIVNVLLAVGDLQAAAQLTAKSLAISVQINGLDSQQVLNHHTQLAVLNVELGDIKTASQHFLCARYLLHIMGGERHSELGNIFSRLAVLYDQCVSSYESTVACISRARSFTSDLLRSSMLMISMADVSFRYGYVHQALEIQKNGYRVLKELLGPENERFLESKSNLEKYIRAANEANKQSFSSFNKQMEEQIAQIKQQLQKQEVEKIAEKSNVTPYNLDDENEDFNAEGAYRPGGKQKKKTGGGSKKNKAKK